MRNIFLRFCCAFSLLLGALVRVETTQAQPAVELYNSVAPLEITAIAPDNSGNIFLAGTTPSDKVNFEGMPTRRGIVAKWNIAQRRMVWTQPMNYATHVAVAGSSVYVVCRKGWGMNEPSHHTKMQVADTVITSLIGGEGSEAFVVKLEDRGTTSHAVWVKQLSGSGYTSLALNALAIQDHNLYLGGGFKGEKLNFDAIQLTDGNARDFNRFSPSSYDAFVAKLIDEGKTARFGWAQKIDGAEGDYGSTDEVTSLSVRDTSIYVAGTFTGNSLTLGHLVVGKPISNARWRGYPDESLAHTFVAKLTDQGSQSHFVWAQLVTGLNNPVALAVSGTSIYAVGRFHGEAGFGSLHLHNNAQQDSADLYFAKIKDEGPHSYFSWVRQIGARNKYVASALVAQGPDVYMAGYFPNPLWVVGAGPPTPAHVPSETWLIKLSDDARTSTYLWAMKTDTMSFTAAHLLALRGTTLCVANENGFALLPLAGPEPATPLGMPGRRAQRLKRLKAERPASSP